MRAPRDGVVPTFPISQYLCTLSVLACVVLGASACQPRNTDVEPLGREALKIRSYDRAIEQADAYLKANADSERAAEAWYVRGRAYQDKVAKNSTEASRNFAEARRSYQKGLLLQADDKLRGYLQASLGNVLYFEGDYARAAAELERGIPLLKEASARAWALYRLGLAQQRQGKFNDADNSFAKVIREHANTVPADSAAKRVGARGFYVQVGAFNASTSADTLQAQLRSQGHSVQRTRDDEKRHVVRVGPIKTYTQAVEAKKRLESRFPDCFITP